jgi:glycosyltransferase involved in cell wall biosynthesis
MPQISVIIPTYNRERFVGKSIDSVMRQSFTDLELIVVDDGSTDGSRQILEAYGADVRCIFQENAGVSSARNAGIRAAQGTWVAFLDSDDEWKEDYLSCQVAQIKKFPEAVAHIANAVTILPDGGRSSLFFETGLLDRFNKEPCLVFERPLRAIIEHSPWFLQSSVIRREALIKAELLDEELSIAEDLDIIARVALGGPVSFCRNELVEVYRREESIMNLGAQSLKRGTYRHDAFGKVYTNLLGSPGLNREEKAAIAIALSNTKRALGNVLVMADRNAEARQVYKQALSLDHSVRSLIKVVGTFLPPIVSRVLVRKGRSV